MAISAILKVQKLPNTKFIKKTGVLPMVFKMATEWKRYKCPRCGKLFDEEDMQLLPGVHCPYCGYRIILKNRPPIAKKVKAV